MTTEKKANVPRFYVRKDADGRWIWDYWRAGDPRPSAPVLFQTLAEARDVADEKNRHPAGPTGGEQTGLPFA